jgi:hypothetical protein
VKPFSGCLRNWGVSITQLNPANHAERRVEHNVPERSTCRLLNARSQNFRSRSPISEVGKAGAGRWTANSTIDNGIFIFSSQKALLGVKSMALHETLVFANFQQKLGLFRAAPLRP